MRDNTSQGIYSDLITIKDVFHNHLKIMKNLQYILCRNHEKICAATSKRKMCRNRKCAAIFFYIEDCMIASRNISMFFKERAAASEKILRKNDCF